MQDQLQELVAKWANYSKRRFQLAKEEDDEFAKKFFENGAVILFNCARDLDALCETKFFSE
jgi:hypothetical protein